MLGQRKASGNVGTTIFSQACLCRLKCRFDGTGKVIPAGGTICMFRGNEKNCPVFEEGQPTQLTE
jgi:hypothetical protein